MKIRKMTATFGCLDNATLEPSDGVQMLTLGNEGGKTTWSEFLLAMFYGLDTRRSSKGRLSHKERFSPWNGKPMEGLLELDMEGRTIIVQRTSTASKPFSIFKAWDKHTGMEIPSLTAENCGRKILGVEREVFRRSAFLCGTELAVTPEHDLSRRLESLAAAGRQTDSFLRADQTLLSWHNRLRYHQSGEIPKLEKRLKELQQAQEELPPTDHLPEPEQLLRMLAALDPKQIPQTCPPALENLSDEEILPKAQKDLLGRRVKLAAWFLAAAAFAAGGVWLSYYLFAPALLALVLGLLGMRSRRLSRQYGVETVDQILPAAVQWRDVEKQRHEQQLVVELVQGFAPHVRTVSEARDAVAQAMELHRLSEQIAANSPDPDEVAALEADMARLHRREQAISLARAALAQANTVLQQDYVPRLTSLAGSYLQSLTLGRYDQLVMSQSMELSIRRCDGFLRPLAAVSTGTQDQTWLALRLAMTRLLLPPGAPMVLDDALLTFDLQRQQAALDVLEQEDRQILIFSCR